MNCQTRCEGSKFNPSVFSGLFSNIVRHTSGDTARFLPPGHSSLLNSMGQFSMAIFTPACSA